MDSVYVRTAADLERKYNLGELKRNVEINNQAIVQTTRELDNFIDVTTTNEANLQEQIDGKIDTWYYQGVPSLSNPPASTWTTDEIKSHHIGDLYFDQDTARGYIFRLSSGAFSWQELEDTGISAALEAAAAAQDTADSKRRIFTTTPTPPYDKGDLWTQGSNGDIYVCNTSRQTGSYTSTDWVLASKYTDDSALNTFVSGTYASTISALESSIDGKSETYYQSTNPADNWSQAEKAKHVGDLWYDTTNDTNYYYDSTYTWQEMSSVPQEVYDKIDGKSQIFTTQPTPPYQVGDLWVQGSTGDIKHCTNTRASGSYVASDWVISSKYTDDSSLNTFMTGSYASTISSLESSIDGKSETFYQSTNPASNWSSAEKAKHVGDLWYDSANNKNYIYDSNYTWQEVDNVPQDVYDKIDGKNQIFTTQPVPPYQKGDLWVQGSTGDIKHCTNTRSSGSYVASDWILSSKYTDDSALTTFVNGSYATTISTINSQIDGKSETFYQSTNPANSWSTAAEKDKHIGDLWYDTSVGSSYIYVKSGSTYSWEEADGVPQSVYDAIDGKAQIFTSQPTPPYYVGDLWVQGSTGDIKHCTNERTTGSYTSSDWVKSSKYTDDSNLTTFVNTTYAAAMSAVDDAIKEKITTWYYSGTPTLNNAPANTWTTNDLKLQHVGDMYYDQSTGFAYRFNYSNSVFEWIVIHDKNATDALSIASDAYDTADNKRRVFTDTPTPPYDNGDLWVGGESGDIKVCQIAKEEGQPYEVDDWIIASKYTDNTYASAIVDEMGGTTTTILSGQIVREMANYTKFEDLKTGGSTEIAGENITTGTIKSKNYVQDTSGTKIDLSNGKISTAYTDIDDNGFKAKSKDGEYILINPQVGFSAYDKNNNRIYYGDRDMFYMKKATAQEQISLAPAADNRLDILPMEKYTNGTLTNRGFGFI